MEISELIKLSNELDDEVWISGGVSIDKIDILEKSMGVKLPGSYKEFLRLYGSIQVYDNCISGIVTDDPLEMSGSNIYADTNFMRDDYSGQYVVPNYLWVLQSHEDGAYCFNVNIVTEGDEFAIVNYEPYLPEESYKEVIASTFNEYINNRFFYNVSDKKC